MCPHPHMPPGAAHPHTPPRAAHPHALPRATRVLNCSLLYDTVDEALAKELYEHYGGVVRYVLKFPYGRPDKGLDELLESLHWAVGACFGEQVGGCRGDLRTCPCVGSAVR